MRILVRMLNVLSFSVSLLLVRNFNISVEMSGNDVKSFIHNLYECYDSYDPDYEAYLWIGEDGHGKNGAPYHIKDIVEDMEAAEKYILDLYLTLEEKYGK